MNGQSDRLLFRVGFFAALVMSFVCLAFCVFYLVTYQQGTSVLLARMIEASKAPELSETQQWALQLTSAGNVYTSKVMLQSCGIVAGIAFGFLGFCLFLMGIEGQIDATIEQAGAAKIDVTRLAPGAFILLMATILIGLCSTLRIPVKLDTQSTPQVEHSRAHPGADDDGPANLDTSEPGAADNGQSNAQ